MQKVIITGTLGFIGSNFIRKVVPKYSEYQFIGIDNAVKTYNLDNSFNDPNFKFYLADISDIHIMNNIFSIEKPNIVIGMAAESFVDNSITNIAPFLHTNVIGTQVLIDMCLKYKAKLIHISTDEVYGQKLSVNDPAWIENDPILPRNPYSCSKGASELIVNAAHYTHGLQFNMTRSCNVFGPRQKRENLIPHIINSLIHNTEIKIHGTGNNFRQWVFVDDKIDAIMNILKNGKSNETYNIGTNSFYTNLEMVNYIAKLMNKDPKITFITDRKSHDMGYSVSADKLKTLGWKPQVSFNEGMKRTINWYLKK